MITQIVGGTKTRVKYRNARTSSRSPQIHKRSRSVRVCVRTCFWGKPVEHGTVAAERWQTKCPRIQSRSCVRA